MQIFANGKWHFLFFHGILHDPKDLDDQLKKSRGKNLIIVWLLHGILSYFDHRQNYL